LAADELIKGRLLAVGLAEVVDFGGQNFVTPTHQEADAAADLQESE
jgi:hypothetical protein